MPVERPGAVKMRGNPVTLIGPEVRVGQKAPDFVALGQGLKPISLQDFLGKVKVLLSVPSLDTQVCSTETKKFNEMAAAFPSNVQVAVISMDLPFAQARWCGANGVERVLCASDFRDRQFGEAYGVRIKELGLLARAVFVVDRDDVVRYVEYVPEITQEPNYEAVKQAVLQIAGP
jgi:thiol peroxidase